MRIFISVLSFALIFGFIFHPGEPKTGLQFAVNFIKNNASLKYGQFGVHIINTSNDSVMASLNPDLGLVPASALKIITTATALEILGSEFRYETRLNYIGNYDSLNGILDGDLLIVGSGDPTFGSKHFKSKTDTIDILEKWVIALKKKGVREIKGSVVADASCFEAEMIPSTWIWADMGNYFGAGACGLNYHDNLFTVQFRSGETGTKTKITGVVPFVPQLKLVNKVTAGGTGDNAFIYGSEYDNNRYITGTIPANKENFEIDGSLPDPAFFCAWSLDSMLRKHGIKVSKEPMTLAYDHEEFKPKTFFISYSPPLKDVVHLTNRYSVNLYAECLLKTTARKSTGFGTNAAGCGKIAEFWQGKGINTAGMFQNDGSGLSRWNTISAKHFTSILKWMTQSKHFGIFYNSLPEQGNGIRAKGGYITRVRSYAGYLKRPDGEYIAFAMIMNNYTGTPKDARYLLETLMLAIK